jgi:hypothetical protein
VENVEFINAVLLEPITCTEPEQILAVQFRALVRNQGLSPEQWGEKVTKYLDKTLPKDATQATRTAARGNLMQELVRPVITWKVFLKGIEVLGADIATFFFTILDRDNKSASTAVTIRYPK